LVKRVALTKIIPTKPVNAINLDPFYKKPLLKILMQSAKLTWSRERYLILMLLSPIIIPALPILFLFWMGIEIKKIVCVEL